MWYCIRTPQTKIRQTSPPPKKKHPCVKKIILCYSIYSICISKQMVLKTGYECSHLIQLVQSCTRILLYHRRIFSEFSAKILPVFHFISGTAIPFIYLYALSFSIFHISLDFSFPSEISFWGFGVEKYCIQLQILLLDQGIRLSVPLPSSPHGFVSWYQRAILGGQGVIKSKYFFPKT